jgi:biotin synthase-like enzyme
MEKCKYCGLIQGHANSCYATILIEKVLAFEHVVERAKILLEAPTEHARLVAEGKLKDAIGELDRIERRQSVKV